MAALARVRGDLHFPQQGVHFRPAQQPPGAHTGMTGHGGANIPQPVLERQGFIHFAQIVGHVAHQALDIHLAQQRRNLADHHGADAKRLNDQTQFLQFGSASGYASGGVLGQLHHLGHQQQLPGDAGGGQLRLDAFVDQPFVGGVLIDDDHAVGGFGHYIGGVQLRPGRAQGVGFVRRSVGLG